MTGLGTTQRTDAWWLGPLMTALGLGSFIFYATWAAVQGDHYKSGPYLSPFYSPLFLFDWWKFSPAFLTLWAPAGFRATCYYYRKAYYRALFWDPPACAVGEARCGYRGEAFFPLIIQNIHRYFLYLAIGFLVVLWMDVFHAFHFHGEFGIGVGTLVLFANSFLLSGYTLSCHCFRHLVGGRLDFFSTAPCGKARHTIWSVVSELNGHHMLWAWMSLFAVGFADLYIRLCSMGIWTDLRIF